MQKIFKMSFIGFLSLILMFPAVAQETVKDSAQNSVQESLIENANAAKLNQLLTSLETFQADFIQIITTETGEQLDKLSGQFSLKKPGKFNWEVMQPFAQVLIADGQYLWQYDADLEQAMVRDLDESLAGTPAQLLSGSLSELQNIYQIEYNQNEFEVFNLVPKQEGQFESIQLSFKEGALRQLHLVDTLGQTTHVSFNNAKFGMALDNSLFILKLEEGVELVDSRKYLATTDG